VSTRSRVLWILNALLVVGALALVGVGGWQMVTKSRPAPASPANQPELRLAVLEAASRITEKILTYSPDTVELDLADGSSGLTGDFAEYYKKFSKETIVPGAREKQVKTTATVVQSGIISIESPEQAAALVFIDQVTTSLDFPEPNHATSSVRVGLTKVDGRWLIESFDPV